MTHVELRRAHDHCSNHRAELAISELAGCFYCERVFDPDLIEEFVGTFRKRFLFENTALCPFCGIDAVVGSAAGFPLTEDFLSEMHAEWFGDL